MITEYVGASLPALPLPVWFDGAPIQTRIFRREDLRPGDTFVGPAIVTEYTSATVVPPGDVVRVDGFHNMVIEVQP